MNIISVMLICGLCAISTSLVCPPSIPLSESEPSLSISSSRIHWIHRTAEWIESHAEMSQDNVWFSGYGVIQPDLYSTAWFSALNIFVGNKPALTTHNSIWIKSDVIMAPKKLERDHLDGLPLLENYYLLVQSLKYNHITIPRVDLERNLLLLFDKKTDLFSWGTSSPGNMYATAVALNIYKTIGLSYIPHVMQKQILSVAEKNLQDPDFSIELTALEIIKDLNFSAKNNKYIIIAYNRIKHILISNLKYFNPYYAQNVVIPFIEVSRYIYGQRAFQVPASYIRKLTYYSDHLDFAISPDPQLLYYDLKLLHIEGYHKQNKNSWFLYKNYIYIYRVGGGWRLPVDSKPNIEYTYDAISSLICIDPMYVTKFKSLILRWVVDTENGRALTLRQAYFLVRINTILHGPFMHTIHFIGEDHNSINNFFWIDSLEDLGYNLDKFKSKLKFIHFTNEIDTYKGRNILSSEYNLDSVVMLLRLIMSKYPHYRTEHAIQIMELISRYRVTGRFYSLKAGQTEPDLWGSYLGCWITWRISRYITGPSIGALINDDGGISPVVNQGPDLLSTWMGIQELLRPVSTWDGSF